MVRNNQKGRLIKKINQVLKFLKDNATTAREWAIAIASCIGLFTVILGALEFSLERENEAMARYQRVMRDLGDPSSTVRAGALVAMADLMEKDYEKYGKPTLRVLVSSLATEDDDFLIETILYVLGHQKVKAIDVTAPLVLMNQTLTDRIIHDGLGEVRSEYELPSKVKLKERDWIEGAIPYKKSLLESVIRGQFHNFRLQVINEALVTILRRSSTEELKKLDLSGAFLVSPIGDYIHLENAKLEEAVLNRAFLYRVNLTDAVLKGAKLEDTLLVEAVLENAELSGANLAKVDLAGAKLRKAKFVKADLYDANLVDANMSEAILDEANIYGAFFTNAILEGARFNRAKMMGTHLERANLKYAELENANLIGADLSSADLSGAYLTDANLTGTILQGANLERANLEGADLEYADLRAKVLFSIDSNEFQSDLNKGGMVSEYLQQEFEKNGFYLPRSAILSVEETDQKWLINDEDIDIEYTIREENEQLNICIETKFDFKDIKKARNWQKAIFEDDIKEKLSSSKD